MTRSFDSSESTDPAESIGSSDPFVRYLNAKRTVDDRALHRPTFERLVTALETRAANRGDDPVRILEVGVGTGTMLPRLCDWNALSGDVVYVGVDTRDAAIAAAADKLTERSFECIGERRFRLETDERTLTVELHVADAFSWASALAAGTVDCVIDELAGDDPTFDLLIAMAFLDVVEFDRAAEALFPLVAGSGLGYFPITFDGETIFEPVSDAERNAAVLDAYHAAMDAPDRPGGSNTGRRLFSALPAANAERLAAGGSDWVVAPDDDAYPADERAFCRYIVDTIERAVLTETPAPARAGLSDSDVVAWADDRRAQLDRGTLVYCAHGFDHLVRFP